MSKLKRFATDPNPAGVMLYLTALAILCAVVVAAAVPGRADPPTGNTGQSEHADGMLAHLVELAPRHPARNDGYRAELAAAIERNSDVYDIPVSLIVSIFF